MNKRILLTTLAVVIVAAGVVAAVAVARNDKPGAGTKGPGNPEDTSKGGPAPGGPLTVELNISKDHRYGEKMVFKSIVRNVSGQEQQRTFKSTCTQGTLYIDSKETQRSRVCGDAITDVVLQPGESKQYAYTFQLEKTIKDGIGQPLDGSSQTVDFDGKLALKPGRHQAYVDWQGAKSNTVTFNVAE